MSIKFTTTEKENPNISLLFEFLDHEVPEEVEITLRTSLGKNEFNGGLQSNQINGIFLEPITINGKFHGTYVRKDDSGQNIITADERSQELGRLQGRVVKFFFENMTSYVIIERFRRVYKDLCDIQFELTLAPHDFQEVVKPEGVLYYNERGADLIKTDIPAKTGFPDGEVLDEVIKAGNELDNDSKQIISSVKVTGTQDAVNNVSKRNLGAIQALTDKDNTINRELAELRGEGDQNINTFVNKFRTDGQFDFTSNRKAELLEEKKAIRQELAGILGYKTSELREDIPLVNIVQNSNEKMRFYNSYKNNPALKGITRSTEGN